MELSVDNIPYVATAMAQSDVLTKVGVGVLESQLDVASAEVAELTKMMELSVNPNIGANFDALV